MHALVQPCMQEASWGAEQDKVCICLCVTVISQQLSCEGQGPFLAALQERLSQTGKPGEADVAGTRHNFSFSARVSTIAQDVPDMQAFFMGLRVSQPQSKVTGPPALCSLSAANPAACDKAAPMSCE